MLVWACIAPHGGSVVEELSEGNPQLMAITRGGMRVLQQASSELTIDTFIVLTPHGQRSPGQITIGLTNHCVGELNSDDGGHIEAGFETDLQLATILLNEMVRLGIPGIGLISEEGCDESLVLDWGSLIPLWFLAAPRRTLPKVVVACMCPSISRADMIAFGLSIVRAATLLGRGVALICSANQGHGHLEDGPYGFSPESNEHDDAYLRAISENRLETILDWEDGWIEAALTDSYPQTVALYGASLIMPMTPKLVSYEHPTYFGMLCAYFEPRNPVQEC